MIQLTEEQRQAIANSAESPPTVVDPLTKTAYVLLRREIYERFQAMLDEDDARLMAPLLADLDPEDWEDVSACEGDHEGSALLMQQVNDCAKLALELP
jgi:hypothetical protein